MTGKEFELLLLERMRCHEKAGVATMARCGTQSVRIDGEWTPVSSLPDFEGVVFGGRQFIVEAKVCSAASFPLHDDKFKRRQLRHMKLRDSFGVVCVLAIHFSERVLKTRIDPAMTIAFPVSSLHSFWIEHDAGEKRTLGRAEAMSLGVVVEWNTPNGQGKPRPDILPAIERLMQ